MYENLNDSSSMSLKITNYKSLKNNNYRKQVPVLIDYIKNLINKYRVVKSKLIYHF